MNNFLKGRLITVRLILLTTTVVLVGVGIAAIYSVGYPADPAPDQSGDLANKWQKQAFYTVLSIIAFVALNLINYRRLGSVSYWIYSAILALLALLLLDRFVDLPFVPVVNNSRRWLRIGIGSRFLQLQPSEFCKLAYILALAWYLRFKSNYSRFTSLVCPFAVTLLPMMLILLQPDLGTVILIMPILFVMLFVAGAKVKHLLIIILLAVLLSPLMWHFMKPYQRTRISSVLLQSKKIRDTAEKNRTFANILVGKDKEFSTKQWKNDWGYHLIRSKYAIASGGLGGHGFGKGPFIKYNFLPERHNDFIFAVIAHQFGFIGCLALAALYAVLIACGLEIAANNTDPFARLLAVGIVTMFTVEVLVNIGMTIGLMPITGLTLPLVSYGGSSLMVSISAVALLNNIGRSRAFTVAPKSFE